MKLATVAFVGRMNVGKSTLFNRLIGRPKSMAYDYAGVTRDIIKEPISWQGKTFELIDTGGLVFRKSEDQLVAKVHQKALGAVTEADVVVFVTDGVVGVVAEDREIARFLHKAGKKVIVAINKSDDQQTLQHEHEFLALGFSEIVSLSAQHGRGIEDLLSAVVTALPYRETTEDSETNYHVMLLGRPNVGKSSLMNALVQQERSIVSDIPGTTREAISEKISWAQEHLEIVDTPGVRRSRSVTEELESLMVHSALHALRKADIVVLVIDGSEGKLVDQELKLGFYAFQQQHKALVLVVNKSDIVTDEKRRELDDVFDYYRHFIEKIPVVSISCKTGENVDQVLPAIKQVWDAYGQRFDDAELKRLFVGNLELTPLVRNQNFLKIIHVKQVGTAPITIVLTVNNADWFGESQLSFFENIMRKKWDLTGVSVRFIARTAK